MQRMERIVLTRQSFVSGLQSPVIHGGSIKAWCCSAPACVLNLNSHTMGKIIFYEDRNFQGRSYECSADCAELHSHFSRCNSIKVDSGCWVAYEKANYNGYQYMLYKGEYPDFQRWSGFNDCIRSCRMVPPYTGNYRMKIFERSDFRGQTMEMSEDCPDLHEVFHKGDISSANVMEGYWILHEHTNYRGRQYFLRPGEYRRYSEWGSTSPIYGSLRRVTEQN